MREVLTRCSMVALELQLTERSASGAQRRRRVPRGLIRDQFVAQTAGERLSRYGLDESRHGAPFELGDDANGVRADPETRPTEGAAPKRK